MENKQDRRPRFLLSNDDGAAANGLKVLLEIVKPLGDTTVVAPNKGNSGQGHAVTLSRPLYLRKIDTPLLDEFYTCSGTPADCVKIGIHEVVEHKPDFIFSGVNHGSNSSISVVYSGTMAAAIEGCLNGIPSIGFSLLDHSHDADFSGVERYGAAIVENLIKNGLPKGTCLNVNFPAIPADEIKGVKICRQTRGRWNEKFVKRQDPRGHDYYWLTGHYDNFEPDADDTDEWALANNYIAIVPITIDWTSSFAMRELKSWKF